MFNDIIVRHFSDATYAAELDAHGAVIELGNPVCGDRIRVQFEVENDLIKGVRFQAWGCATSLATGNIFCTQVDGKTLSEIDELTRADIEHMLGEIEPSQHHCLEMLHSLFTRLRQYKAA
ncbi:iron-sulfur cluster assembly scaffold protein [Pseudomonas yamanorum]